MVRTKKDVENMRLLAEDVFAGFAETFGLSQTAVKIWAQRTHQTLSLLLDSNYREEELEFYKQTESYVKVVELLIDHQEEIEHIIGKGGVRILSIGLGKIIDRTNEAIAAQISETEIGLFCLMAKGGRKIFAEAQCKPEDFVPDDVYSLAEQIRANYSAYEETLQGLRA